MSVFDRVIRQGLRLNRCISGVTAVEYGLIVSFIGIALIIGATALGDAIGNGLFQGLADYFKGLDPSSSN
jgi:Flp pilus assembly pilin Flp